MNSRRDRLARDRQARAAGLAAGGPVVGCDREARAVGLAAGGPGLPVFRLLVGFEMLVALGLLLPNLPFFSLRQGVKSFLNRNGSCLTSFILIPAGYEKLVAKG